MEIIDIKQAAQNKAEAAKKAEEDTIKTYDYVITFADGRDPAEAHGYLAHGGNFISIIDKFGVPTHLWPFEVVESVRIA